MKIKTTMRHQLSLVRKIIIKKTRDVDNGKCYVLWLDCKFVQPLWKRVWMILKKLKIELLYDLAILLLGIYPK